MTAVAILLGQAHTPTVADVLFGLSHFEGDRGALGAPVSAMGDTSRTLTGVRQDSRQVRPGELFCARDGRATKGSAFVNDAIARGAAAVLAKRGSISEPLAVPLIEVEDPARVLGFVAEFVYGRPSRALPLVGITGTNGKTTTASLLEQALRALSRRPARLGTLGYSFGEEQREGSLTTPEADEISRLLAEVRDAGGTEFVMEVSSIALASARVDALSFGVAAFTNLSQDHLDFHGSMSAYAVAKARLFDELGPRASVLNIDDRFGAELAGRARGTLITTGRAQAAMVRPLSTALDASGIRARVATPAGVVELESSLIGEHNLENLLTALGVLLALGIDAEAAARALALATGAPGRLERCDTPDDDVRVLVDYAHTDDALENVLRALRSVTRGELVCVFGCGGDRDASKRPRMGAAVAHGASRAFITSDNPRSEDPKNIARAIVPGFARSSTPYVVELDRRLAIRRAILEAVPGDTVLIAGKGHEPYQIIGAERLPFDDRTVAREALAERRTGARS
jgi:UDP-N-acetylmuramoyl-L-alanyl-D-glutamate--2,6-diaminopimelate ligase